MQIIQLPAFDDNYHFIIESQGMVAVVDPGDPRVVEAELEKHDWRLEMILNTHHHADHTGGNKYLRAKYGCLIVGPSYDTNRIPFIDKEVSEGDEIELGDAKAKVIFTPGHTTGHILFHFEREKALFCGDTLFNLGCGRMFEGNPEMFWDSLKKIKSLPEDTQVYCAHEYTEANLKFCQSIDPDNQELAKQAEIIKELRLKGEATVPFSLGDNLKSNPFLRADTKELQAIMGLDNPAEVFGAVRKKKDSF
jgi:hydroxyacylglutathione hydrolase